MVSQYPAGQAGRRVPIVPIRDVVALSRYRLRGDRVRSARVAYDRVTFAYELRDRAVLGEVFADPHDELSADRGCQLLERFEALRVDREELARLECARPERPFEIDVQEFVRDAVNWLDDPDGVDREVLVLEDSGERIGVVMHEDDDGSPTRLFSRRSQIVSRTRRTGRRGRRQARRKKYTIITINKMTTSVPAPMYTVIPSQSSSASVSAGGCVALLRARQLRLGPCRLRLP